MLALIAYLALFVAAANCQNATYICGNDNNNITCEYKPCNPRLYPDAESIVCVCNETYCDNYVHTYPTTNNECIQTTSSKAGERYNKSNCTVTAGNLNAAQIIYERTINKRIVAYVNTSIRCTQLIQGFGAALTDAAGYLLYILPEAVRNYLLNSYYGKCGNRYIFVRVPVAGSDFSTHFYTYHDNYPYGVFNLTIEDYLYKLPPLNKIIDIKNSTNDLGDCCDKLKIIAACWSPPLAMKTNNVTSGQDGINYLKPEHYYNYTMYLKTFIEMYQENLGGHKLYAISTMNEPFNGRVPLSRINACGLTPKQVDVLLKDYFCPLLSSIIKILILDDQTALSTELLPQLSAEALACVSYIAKHWYTDFLLLPGVLGTTLDFMNTFKLIMSTESCNGANPWDDAVDFGSWIRGEKYASAIIEDLIHCVTAWIDWNMCLNTTGGYTYIDNRVDSPIIVNATANEFFKNPMYYFMGHFSMFVPPCSVRIEMKLHALDDAINVLVSTYKYVAFLTPKGTIVIIIQNEGTVSKTFLVVVSGGRIVTIVSPARSIVTVEIKDSTTS